MFERPQKPFLTVDTGEAYQPIRLTYEIHQKDKLIERLNAMACCKKGRNANTWDWFWQNECADLPFESLESYQQSTSAPLRLGTFSVCDQSLFLTLPSFKRACLAIPFCQRMIHSSLASLQYADFVNHVFGIDSQLPHNVTDVFDHNALENRLAQRLADYDIVQTKCEQANTAEEALAILSAYTEAESKKCLPYAERHTFQHDNNKDDPNTAFHSFYIYLRSRELVAIRRWFSDTGYSLSDAADETIEKVFGNVNLGLMDSTA